MLSAYDLRGMRNLGMIESRHRQYVVDGLKQDFLATSQPAIQADSSPKVAPQPLAREQYPHQQASRTGKDDPVQEEPSNIVPELLAARPTKTEGAKTAGASVADQALTLTDLARRPAPGTKKYCSYWIRRGECDFAQQGCMYRHEMPLDRAALETIGLRDIPPWYREKHGLGSYLACDVRPKSPGDDRLSLTARSWRRKLEKAHKAPGESSDGDGHDIPKDFPAKPTIKSSADSDVPAFVPAPSSKAAALNRSWTRVPRPTVGTRAKYRQSDRRKFQSAASSTQRMSPPTSCSSNKTPIAGLADPPKDSHAVAPVCVDQVHQAYSPAPSEAPSLSTLALRETVQQLEACEERERLALEKYPPLVPKKTSTTSTPQPMASSAAEKSASVCEARSIAHQERRMPAQPDEARMESAVPTTTPEPCSPIVLPVSQLCLPEGIVVRPTCESPPTASSTSEASFRSLSPTQSMGSHVFTSSELASEQSSDSQPLEPICAGRGGSMSTGSRSRNTRGSSRSVKSRGSQKDSSEGSQASSGSTREQRRRRRGKELGREEHD